MNSSAISPLVSLCLKVIGVVMIASALLDYVVLALPLNILESQWQLKYIGTLVDRGIVPMVGIGFILVAYWIDGLVGTGATEGKKSGFDLRLPMFFISVFLGAVFLVSIPIYISNLGKASTNAMEALKQQATQAETRLQEEFDRLNTLAQNPQALQQVSQRLQQINQALSAGKVQGQNLTQEQRTQLEQGKQQLENLQTLAKDPKQIETRLNELQITLRETKINQENLAKTEVFKQGLRVGLGSLMLSIGYGVIGGFGIKGMGSFQGKRRSATR